MEDDSLEDECEDSEEDEEDDEEDDELDDEEDDDDELLDDELELDELLELLENPAELELENDEVDDEEYSSSPSIVEIGSSAITPNIILAPAYLLVSFCDPGTFAATAAPPGWPDLIAATP